MAGAATTAVDLLGEHREALEEALREAVGREDSPLVAAARYAMGWEDAAGNPAANTGKRIRPALCLFAAELFGGAVVDAMPGAVAVELVHNFSLVHDEVQDHDAERHHRPTLWARLGEAQAINAGDYLYMCAVRALSDASGAPEARLAALGVLNRAIGEMIGGQWRDIAFERRLDVGVDEYIEMIAGKTGALLAAPLEIGALLAGATAEQAALLGRWGVQVGLAFQVHDDYLGTWGDPEDTGKSNVNDVARRKKTLPVLMGLADGAAREVIVTAYAASGGELPREAVRDVVAALEAAGVRERTRERSRGYAAAADGLLDELDLTGERREQLRQVAAYLVERAG